MNPIKDAITLVGSVTELAQALKVTPQAVCFWRDGKRKIPADKCPLIERVTGGIVTCEALRSDVDWSYIRGTAHVQQPSAAEALKTVALHLLPKNGQPVDENMQLVERRTGLPTRRLAQQPFTGPDQRVGPACRRGYVLPEVAAVLPAGI